MTLKFIHLTDTHLVEPGRILYGTDPLQRLRSALDSIVEEHGDAAFVMVTGDLAHEGQAEAYEALRGALQRMPMPVHLAIGNHDDRPRLRAAFADLPADPNGHVQYAFTAGGIRHVVLDSHEPGVSWGVFCAERGRWLSHELRAHPDLPVHIYIHHPPFGVGIPAMDRISLRDPVHLHEALSPFGGRIRHLFFGHLHRPLAGSWLGIPTSTVRGTNHQVALNLRDSDRVGGSAEPPQYGVVLADATRTLVHFHDFADRSERFPL